jgi:hypothetical protein
VGTRFSGGAVFGPPFSFEHNSGAVVLACGPLVERELLSRRKLRRLRKARSA